MKNILKPVPKGLKYSQRQLAMGMKVEMEHTNYKSIARRIALHHLAEDSKYYTKLKKVEKH